MPYVIFSIDNSTDPHSVHRFSEWLAYMKTAQRLEGKVIRCVGRWQGQDEVSFISRLDDFIKIEEAGFCNEQEAVIHVASGNKMEACLVYQDGSREGIGCMHEVSAEEALLAEGYTYRPDMDVYWVAKEGNPDRVPGQADGVVFKSSWREPDNLAVAAE